MTSGELAAPQMFLPMLVAEVLCFPHSSPTATPPHEGNSIDGEDARLVARQNRNEEAGEDLQKIKGQNCPSCAFFMDMNDGQ